MDGNGRSARRSLVRLHLGAGMTALVTVLAIAGCSVETTHIESPSPTASPRASAAPEFSGPFAADYARAWIESDSDFVHRALADEKISGAEWNEVEERMTSCFAAEGATFDGHTSDGGYSAQRNSLSSDRLNAVMEECERSSGEAWLGFLWFWPQKNPNNLPLEEVVRECMIRNGIVAPDYTAEEFLRDNPTLSFPYLRSGAGERGALECNVDPRVTLRDESGASVSPGDSYAP